ncbi:hypothetical protein Bca4012_084428 [Brassica carinata]
MHLESHQDAGAEFVWAVNAKEKVVGETLNHLTMEITWALVRSRLNFKELQKFKPGDDSPTISPSYLGYEQESRWRKVVQPSLRLVVKQPLSPRSEMLCFGVVGE